MLQIVGQFALESQILELMKDFPKLIQVLIENYTYACQNNDQTNNKFTSPVQGFEFLKALDSLCGGSDRACAEVVNRGGVKELRLAIMDDPSLKEPYDAYWEIYYGGNCLWHILLADGMKYVPIILKSYDLNKSMKSVRLYSYA